MELHRSTSKDGLSGLISLQARPMIEEILGSVSCPGLTEVEERVNRLTAVDLPAMALENWRAHAAATYAESMWDSRIETLRADVSSRSTSRIRSVQTAWLSSKLPWSFLPRSPSREGCRLDEL